MKFYELKQRPSIEFRMKLNELERKRRKNAEREGLLVASLFVIP